MTDISTIDDETLRRAAQFHGLVHSKTGRPILQNPDGSVSTEESITVNEPGLNEGRFTNIPSIWGGHRLSDGEAVQRAIQSGQSFPAFDTVDEAVAAAKARSQSLGDTLPVSSLSNADDETLKQAAAFHGIQIPETPFGERAGNAITQIVSDTAEGVRKAWTGEDGREEDLPELPRGVRATIKEGVGMLGPKMSLARGDLGKLGVFKTFFPDAPAEIDAHGNVIVSHNGNRHFLNAPGFSSQDVQDIGTAGMIELPLASAGGRAFQGLGLLGRAAGTGAGVATGSVVQDVAAQASGSTEPVDLQTAAIAGLTGGAFEFAAPMLKPFFRRLVGSPRMFRNGRLTDGGRQAIKRLGINPDEITDDFAKKFDALAKDAVSPDDLAGAARQAQASEFDVPLSRGDASQSVTQQGFEDALAKDVHGESAGNVMRGFRVRQSDDLMRARDGLLSDRQGIAPHEGTGAVQDSLRAKSTALKGDIRRAYDDAATASVQRPAMLTREGVFEITDELLKIPREMSIYRDTLAQMPGLKSVLGRIQHLNALSKNPQFRPQNFARFEDSRKALNNLIRDAKPGSTEFAALNAIKGRMDDWVDEAITRGLMAGDESTVEMVKHARGLRAEYGRLFEAEKMIPKLMEMEPSEATKFLFGASQIGAKRGTAKAVRHLKEVLGPNSAEWSMLREEAFGRLFPADKGAIAKFPKAFQKARIDAPELMKELFSADELRKMGRFANVAAMATHRVPGAVNSSNTTNALARLVRELFGANTGPVIRGLGRVLPEGIRNAAGAARASTTIRPARPRNPVPPGLVGTLGSAATQDRRPQTTDERLVNALRGVRTKRTSRDPLADALGGR